MHANFSTEINNLGTKGQSIGVTCRAVALRGGGFALFAGCFVPQNSPPHPKTRHFCPTFYLYKTVSEVFGLKPTSGGLPEIRVRFALAALTLIPSLREGRTR